MFSASCDDPLGGGFDDSQDSHEADPDEVLDDAAVGSVVDVEVVHQAKKDQFTKMPADGNCAYHACLLYTSPSPRDLSTSRMPSSA